MQIDLKEGLASEPIEEGMKHLPKTVTFPQYPFITAYNDDDEEEEEDVFMGELLPSNTCESLLSSPALIRHLDCGLWMVSITLGTRKQK